jgi:hypothetical protein
MPDDVLKTSQARLPIFKDRKAARMDSHETSNFENLTPAMLTELLSKFLSIPASALKDDEKVRAGEFDRKVDEAHKKIQAKNLPKEALERLLAKQLVMSHEFYYKVQSCLKALDTDVPSDPVLDDLVVMAVDSLDRQIESAKRREAEISALKNKPKEIAGKGGLGRKRKFDVLEEETIRIYEAGKSKWTSLPIAAQDITPIIVAMSKDGNGDLLPSTTKPLEWIRAHVKRGKSSPS